MVVLLPGSMGCLVAWKHVFLLQYGCPVSFSLVACCLASWLPCCQATWLLVAWQHGCCQVAWLPFFVARQPGWIVAHQNGALLSGSLYAGCCMPDNLVEWLSGCLDWLLGYPTAWLLSSRLSGRPDLVAKRPGRRVVAWLLGCHVAFWPGSLVFRQSGCLESCLSANCLPNCLRAWQPGCLSDSWQPSCLGLSGNIVAWRAGYMWPESMVTWLSCCLVA